MVAPDVLLSILNKMKGQHPDSVFVNSLYNQYCNRGGLSKKQLEGLLDKARKTAEMSAGHLATLEAIILKKPTRERAAPTIAAVIEQKDTVLEKMLADILSKFPQHKRVLFFQSKFSRNEPLSVAETDEVKKFHKLLMK